MASLISLICLLQALSVNASFKPGVPHDLLRRASATVPAECNSWAEVISLCSDQVPNFASAPYTEQAECLCYEGTSWVPSIFDGWVATCASWAKTSDPTDYTIVDSWAGLCTNVGPVTATPTPLATAKTPAATPTSNAIASLPGSPITTAPASPSMGALPSGCSFAIDIIAYCSAASSTALTDLVECLCYSSTTWLPNKFDSAMSTCASFIKTANPADYVTFSELENFCSDAGPLNAVPTSTLGLLGPLNPVTTTANTAPVATSKVSSGDRAVGNLGFRATWSGFLGMAWALLA